MQTTKPETAQQRPTGARMALLMLLYFIKIGAFTFGSGWSIIAQMEREFVDERGWMTKSDLLELIAVGKSLPGIMVANITLLFGYQMAGVLGGICAAIGLCIPAVVTLTIVTAIYDAIKDNYWVWSALKGVQCAVAPIIGGAAISLGKDALTSAMPIHHLCRRLCALLLYVHQQSDAGGGRCGHRAGLDGGERTWPCLRPSFSSSPRLRRSASPASAVPP